MANKKPWEDEPNSRYRPDTLRLAGRNDAAYQTEKAAQAAYDAVKGEGTPAQFGTYKTPEERLAQQVALREEAEKRAQQAQQAQGTGTANMPTPTAGTGAGTGNAGTAQNTSEYNPIIKPITAKDKLDEILNGEKFSYDLNADPTFQTLLAQFRREGKGAMRDTMAQATALTGGYANSAAQAAAQQAYDRRMDEAFEQVPELEAAAYAKYRDERSDLYNEYSILAAREAAENEEKWRNKEWDLQLERYRVADEQWAKEYGLNVDKFMQDKYEFQESLKLQWADMDLKEKEFALEKWYKEQGIELSKAELQETIRQFNAEIGFKYYAQDQDNAYKYAALAQDDKQFYANLYNKPSGSGSPSNNTPSLTIKTTEDRDAAVAETVQFMLNPAHSADDIDRFVDQWGDWGDTIYSLAEQKIRDKDRAKYFKDDRLK